MDSFHTSVLLKEVIEFLDIKAGKKYIDATLGGGGHSFEILKNGGKVLGIDADQEAIDYVKENIKFGQDLILVRGNFRDLEKIALLNDFKQAAGILFDLGVSGHQLDTKERGFSFQKEGPLDMRMDQNFGVKALDLVNALTKGELYELFTKLGEERNARAISEHIIRARGVNPITKTTELAEIIRKTSPKNFGKIDPATKVFQALRIAVNEELHSLKEALPQAIELLEKGGRLLIISFHSLEDRIVKDAFEEFQKKEMGRSVTKKPIAPSTEEIERNKRSRSAKLRVFEKI